MTALSSGAGRTCCGTSTTSAPSTPMLRHWPGGPTSSTGFTTGPKPALIPRPSGGRTAQLALERQLLALCQPFRHDPSATQAKLCRRIERHTQEPAPYWMRGTLRLRGRTRSAFRQRRRGAQPATSGRQPQDQRRYPLGTGHRQQNDPRFPIRRLAGARSQPTDRLPSTAQIPSTLNCYGKTYHWGCRRP